MSQVDLSPGKIWTIHNPSTFHGPGLYFNVREIANGYILQLSHTHTDTLEEHYCADIPAVGAQVVTLVAAQKTGAVHET